MPQFADMPAEERASRVRKLREALAGIESGLARIERTPGGTDLVAPIVSAVQGLGTTADAAGAVKVATLARAVETALNHACPGAAAVPADVLDAVRVAQDYMRLLIADIATGAAESHTDIAGVIRLLETPLPSAGPAEATASADSAVPPDLVRDYADEMREVLNAIDAALLRLDARPADVDAIHAAFRGFHSVKGTSGFLGLRRVGTLAHAAEDALALFREGLVPVTSAALDTLLVASDHLRGMVRNVERDGRESAGDISGVLTLLQNIGPQGADDRTIALSSGPVVVTAEPEPRTLHAPPPAPPPDPRQPAFAGGAAPDAEGTVRLDVKRLDELLTLAGELHLRRVRAHRTATLAARTLDDPSLAEQLGVEMNALAGISDELRTAVLATRMLPVGQAFAKLPRIVRDAARASGKEIVLDMTGEDTELDRALIEEIRDPLVHLVRNAIDHGICTPDERERLGKPRAGHLRVAAAQEGNRVIISVEDDGAGIDMEKVLACAVDRGVLPADAQTQLTDREIIDLIFYPGFSTGDTVTALSGRGVGLDVVRTHIQRLAGVVEVETTPGVGSRFLLKIPLTLAVIQVLVVGIGSEIYAIPASAVIESLRLERGDVRDGDGHAYITYHGQDLIAGRLSDYLVVPGAARAFTPPAREYAVVVAAADRRAGLIVERLVGQQEIVVKPLGPHLEDARGLSGAAILDDGRVSLVLDVATTVDRILTAESVEV